MKILICVLLFTVISFSQDTNKIVIDENSGKPMLIGKTTTEAFKDTNFAWWYNSGYEFYEPDSALVDKFREQLSAAEITIVSGTWCSDSRRELPRFFRILDYAEYPQEEVNMISVDRDKNAGDSDISSLNIELVPTFIFYRDGEEIGRIIESPVETLEQDIYNILK
jgi:hypothetical protein